MIALHANVISEVFKPNTHARVVTWLESVPGDIVITAITLAELLAGVRRLPDGQRRAALMMAIAATLEPYRATGAVLVFDDPTADHYGHPRHSRGDGSTDQHGGCPDRSDLPIPRRRVCATRNSKDFAHTGVDLIDPWRD